MPPRSRSSALSRTVSHDLKTPISVIGGYAQALTDGTIPPESRDKYLKIIHDRAMAAADMIDSLFSYAKTDHPDYRPHLMLDDNLRAHAQGGHRLLARSGAGGVHD